MPDAATTPLPALRDDLELVEGAPALNGEPRWLIYDAVRHRYFEISGSAFELISVWCDSVERLRVAAEARFNRLVADQDIDAIKSFLLANNLTVAPASGQSQDYFTQALRGRRGRFSQVLHGYLFFRIPLIRPQRALAVCAPLIAPLFSRAFLILTLLAGLAGIYLVSRQWEAFLGTFSHFFSVEGFLLYGVSLIIIKILHELGHAFAAHRYGVRVPTMGVAFMVLFPVLYTDVTDAWRLKSRKQRLAIGAAGISVELAIACFATLFWAILPDGPGKSLAFVLATSSWLLSLLINLNPLMRFDGYYLLMDYWGVSNLQPRAFAMARWWLREILFDLKRPPPEPFTGAQRRKLVVYAVATWIYRFFLFLGIALAVYHLFFKALGVFLFVVEILYFILFPVIREVEAWWLMRKDIAKTRRAATTALVLAGLAALVVLPWSGTVSVPAVMEAGQRSDIFAPRPANVVQVHVANGDTVKAGDVLVTLQAPDLAQRGAIARLRRDLAARRMARVASGDTERSNLRVIEREMQSAKEELRGLAREAAKLTLRAPFDGRVVDLAPELHAGRWVDRTMPLARVIAPGEARIAGLVDETAVTRLREGSSGHFIPDDLFRPKLAVSLTNIAAVGGRKLEQPMLASPLGGPIAAEQDRDGEILALSGQHKLQFKVEGPAPDELVRGIVRIEANPESIAAAAWRNVMRVVIREAGI
jgi:putative peptide zinc metalloprotease protein